MKLRGTFEHITDAGIFSAAYEKIRCIPGYEEKVKALQKLQKAFIEEVTLTNC